MLETRQDGALRRYLPGTGDEAWTVLFDSPPVSAFVGGFEGNLLQKSQVKPDGDEHPRCSSINDICVASFSIALPFVLHENKDPDKARGSTREG